MKLLGIDLETTGLDARKHEIIEVGLVLWDTDMRGPVKQYSAITRADLEEVPPDITHLTGITTDVMLNQGANLGYVLAKMSTYMSIADACVAHNKTFEQGFIAEAESRGLITLPTAPPLWIDTKIDLPFWPGKGHGTLSEILMAHRLSNPMPHRALSDAFAMMQLLDLYHGQLDAIMASARTPSITVSISIPYVGGAEKREAVKAMGYYWSDSKKHWWKSIKEDKYMEEALKASQQGLTLKMESVDA